MHVPIRRGIMKSYRSFPGLVCILFLLIGLASYSLALEVPVFSPLRYSINDVQGTAVYTDTVTMGNVLSGEFHLIVQNGSGGANKVDYAEVYVAGKRLIKMKSTKDLIDKKFKLLQDSEMRIQLTGPKNSFVVVSIIARKLTQVPLVIRMAQADAQTTMTNALLKIKKKPTFASHGFVPEGSVTSQTPRAGTYVKEKSKASITVSTGPDQSYALLPGEPSAPASSAVVNYSSHDRVTDSEIEELSPDVRIIRTKLEIGFTSTTTVGQINDLLTSIGAQITAMLKGVNQVIVRIPDPGTIVALDALIAQIQLNPIVRYVLKSYIPAPAVLPSNVDVVTTPSLMDRIDHHLDVRAHAAWNVKNLFVRNYYQPPFMIVADYFGDGEPNADFGVLSSPGDFETGKSNIHGYHVLGIIAATFEGSSSERGMATGMYPGNLPLLAADLTAGFGWDELIVGLPMILELFGGRVIVNTSLGFTCNASNLLDKSCIEPMALSWIEKVRGSSLYATGLTGPESLENFFLHLTAAGNVVPSALTDIDATFASPITAARLLNTLAITQTATPVMNLTNTLVIENRMKSASPLEGVGCRDATSKYPGNISAIGNNVFSLTGASAGAGYLTGTSMATPQVAGLVAYLWAIKPNLLPQQIIDILVQTSDTSSCGGIDARPLIDAYGAVLALDRGYSDAKVRRELLDVVDSSGNEGGDGSFTEKDIEAFLDAFDAAGGAKDYSRYDLNGDGKTGGDTKAKFNLNIDYPPSYTTVSQTVEETSVSFTENELTDLEVLCYYAYSPLYGGPSEKRKELLADQCGVAGEPKVVIKGGATMAQATLGLEPGNDQDRLLSDSPLPVTLSASGAARDSTVSASAYFNSPGGDTILAIDAYISVMSMISSWQISGDITFRVVIDFPGPGQLEVSANPYWLSSLVGGPRSFARWNLNHCCPACTQEGCSSTVEVYLVSSAGSLDISGEAIVSTEVDQVSASGAGSGRILTFRWIPDK
jgi:subtilisin family serine protease